ncbi:methylated-DNA--[protein]-cysteine S-methyltransferase [Staphylococcus simiae]|uniref:methylated-DNA--[protein]-cysteine S-methyltransferase n=1 Tax=Staphylococcus simiae TaxID=308354 RepID=UPI001A967C60|nr:methylated-DNA--[protein]-cysteine S-methyltransferase [Staphylococcus simiae]MBO1198165.1 methylated-DNA--[protein]-cysteine S-methyltransferase [Staphylococcus simiae]MBO1200291.1 methylated-DNA--[protein]-cysteine S-methyltransferase [Staphylococcus simiae]MBO1202545.1 methylated-DNA--[protein]-cysteine S-methyltransferase [Staphylococcus simiae]MBO1210177.1 methylated-DNA--[protein]-cysteine S-methyltransferase [Staphylococcus simiae]MBO1228689.1 methylated-DNA--[protein]-cysteine S-met
MEYKYYYDSPVGMLELVSDGQSLTAILFSNQQTETTTRQENEQLPIFKQTTAWLDQYFQGHKPDVIVPLNPQGSEFQQHVWSELQAIPYGELTTYGDIAKKVGSLLNKPKMSAQAVGGAVGSNPLSIIVPCHRVVGKNGSLTGFGGTIKNKIKLLEIEDVDMTHLYIPKFSTKP